MADVVTARKRFELQARQLRPRVARLAEQGGTEAVTWRTALEGELAELDRQSGTLAEEEARLRQVASGLDLRVQQVRVRRDALLAGYQAARARAEVGQVLAEIRAADAELLQAVQEAEQRVARTQAIADALQGRAAQRALAPPPPVADEVTRREEELLWGPDADPPHEIRTPGHPRRSEEGGAPRFRGDPGEEERRRQRKEGT